MPYLGHREPEIADLAPSTGAAATAGAGDVLAARAARLVDRVATSATDRRLLLEALGLVDTEQVALAG